MKLSSLSPAVSVLITAAAIVIVGILQTSGLLDSELVDTLIAFLLGGGSGAALAGGFSKQGGV